MNNNIMPIQKLISDTGSIEYRDKTCCHNNCQEAAIISHTIPENYLYKLNSDLSKVLTSEPDLCNIIENPNPLVMKKIVKNKFSTFTGFCAKHDNALFKKIDSFDGAINNEKATLIHYRIICYGINHIKTQKLRLIHISQQNYIKNKLSQPEHENVVKLIKKDILLHRLDYCLKQHMQRKRRLEDMIKNKNFDSIEFIEIPGKLNNPIFSGRSSYLLHLKEKIFQYPGYSYLPWLSYITLLSSSKNHLIFCWLDKDKNHAKRLLFLAKDKKFASIVEVLAYGKSDAFAVDKEFYNKNKLRIHNIITKCRSY